MAHRCVEFHRTIICQFGYTLCIDIVQEKCNTMRRLIRCLYRLKDNLTREKAFTKVKVSRRILRRLALQNSLGRACPENCFAAAAAAVVVVAPAIIVAVAVRELFGLQHAFQPQSLLNSGYRELNNRPSH